MDEMDLTAAETKATCEEIKAYVKEKYHLYVKRELTLPCPSSDSRKSDSFSN